MTQSHSYHNIHDVLPQRTITTVEQTTIVPRTISINVTEMFPRNTKNVAGDGVIVYTDLVSTMIEPRACPGAFRPYRPLFSCTLKRRYWNARKYTLEHVFHSLFNPDTDSVVLVWELSSLPIMREDDDILSAVCLKDPEALHNIQYLTFDQRLTGYIFNAVAHRAWDCEDDSGSNIGMMFLSAFSGLKCLTLRPRRQGFAFETEIFSINNTTDTVGISQRHYKNIMNNLFMGIKARIPEWSFPSLYFESFEEASSEF